MSNEFWAELKRLVDVAEDSSDGDSYSNYVDSYMKMLHHVVNHSPDSKYAAAPDLQNALQNVVVAFKPFASDAVQQFVLSEAKKALAKSHG